MPTAEQIRDRLEKLKIMRASGARRVRFGDRETEYRDDAELTAAINDLQNELDGGDRPRAVKIRSSKGW